MPRYTLAYLRLACTALKYERTVPGPREWSRAIMGMIDRGFWTLVFTSLCTSVDFLLRSKRLQSSHGAKVRAGGKKKRLEGGGGGSFFPLPLPRHSFFFSLSSQLFSTNSRGNAFPLPLKTKSGRHRFQGRRWLYTVSPSFQARTGSSL